MTIANSQSSKTNDTINYSLLDTPVKKKSNTKIDTIQKETKTTPTSTTTVNPFYLTEWEKGFISGLIATLIGFVLTMFWDIYKDRRDKSEKDKIIKKLIQDVLNENLLYISSINAVLTQELGVLNQNKNIITNITTLKNDFWDLIKFNIPKDLLENNDLLKRLQNISSLTKSINENINSREMYRLNNGAMDNFTIRLQYYDELIFTENERLKGLITAFKADY